MPTRTFDLRVKKMERLLVVPKERLFEAAFVASFDDCHFVLKPKRLCRSWLQSVWREKNCVVSGVVILG